MINRIKDMFSKKNKKMMTTEMLYKLKDDEIEFKLFDLLLDKIDGKYDDEYTIITSLPEGVKFFYATWLLELEVNNGGFNQYFFNSASQFLQEAYDGLIYFSSDEYLELLKEAINIYDSEIELHNKVRLEGTIEAFSKSYDETDLNSIDKKFYKLGNMLSEQRVKLIKNNPNEFIF